MIEATNLLNEFNDVVARKPRTLDAVVTASSLLLASALRQLGGEHGLERARLIGAKLESLVKDDNDAMGNFFKAEGDPDA